MTEQVQMLNEEAAQEEQRRNLRVEIIQEIADLERERLQASLGELVVKPSQGPILEF